MMRVKGGDRAAFSTLFERYFPPVVRFITFMLRDRSRAEELAQDVFLSLYRSRHRYEPRTRFRSFLFRLAMNITITEHRSRKREWRARGNQRSWRAGSTSQPVLIEDAVRQSRSEETVLLEKEEIIRLYQALGELPERQRAAILLARAEGMSYEQVAEALGVTVSAVKSLVHRATVYIRNRCREGEP